MRSRFQWIWIVGLLGLQVQAGAQNGFATKVHPGSPSAEMPDGLQGIGVTEKLGNRLDWKGLTFKDESGKSVELQSYLSRGKPVVLAMVYYECPNLCSMLLNGLLERLKTFSWVPGNQFEIVTVSIDPKENSALAAEKKRNYLDALGRPKDRAVFDAGWHFLTGENTAIKALASQIGFRYRYDENEKQYAHGAVLTVLTPEGKISRYLYGIDYPEKDFRLALVEAGNGKIGTFLDRAILFCYHYNPSTRGYSVVVGKVMQIGGLLTVLAMGLALAIFWVRQLGARKGPVET